MKLELTFSLIEYLGRSTEFLGDFSKFLYLPPLVDIYRHPLLNKLVTVVITKDYQVREYIPHTSHIP